MYNAYGYKFKQIMQSKLRRATCLGLQSICLFTNADTIKTPSWFAWFCQKNYPELLYLFFWSLPKITQINLSIFTLEPLYQLYCQAGVFEHSPRVSVRELEVKWIAWKNSARRMEITVIRQHRSLLSEADVLCFSTRSVFFFSFDATAQQRQDGFSPNLHQQTS